MDGRREPTTSSSAVRLTVCSSCKRLKTNDSFAASLTRRFRWAGRCLPAWIIMRLNSLHHCCFWESSIFVDSERLLRPLLTATIFPQPWMMAKHQGHLRFEDQWTEHQISGFPALYSGDFCGLRSDRFSLFHNSLSLLAAPCRRREQNGGARLLQMAP